eukprot:1930141-Amphidinium_carterae.1
MQLRMNYSFKRFGNITVNSKFQTADLGRDIKLQHGGQHLVFHPAAGFAAHNCGVMIQRLKKQFPPAHGPKFDQVRH